MANTRKGRIAGQGSNWIRKDKRLAIYLRDGLCCTYCQASLEGDAQLTLDHVLACEMGGTNEHTNLVTACLSCNSAKSDLSIRAFFKALREKGLDTSGISKRIKRNTDRNLGPYRRQAKQIIANRSKAAGEPITALCK